MSAFTQTFGGSAVSPADVAYASYSFSADFVLFWPEFSAGNPNIAARFMNMAASAPSFNIYMPDATLNSPGYDSIIFNAGSSSFNVVTLNGNAIVTIAPGQVYYVLLNNNSTTDGGWQTVQFGVGTGSANASALAGNGLLAIAGLLNVNLSANTVSSNFTVTSSARAMLYVWTGGSGTGTLPLASVVGNGFVFAVANNGSGSLTMSASGSDTIDGNPTSVFNQTQSGFLISNGVNWSTVGKGIQNTFAVTILNLNVAGNTDVTETSAQAQNIIQQYTGALTGNINVIVPATPQLYIGNNLTSGAFTLTLKTPSGTGIQIVQGSTAILYCDGTNIVNAFTASIGGTVSLTVGSVSAPSLSIQGSASTGIYSPATNQLGIAAGGFDVMRFLAAASAVNYLQARASSTGNAYTLTALGGDTNIDIQLVPKGAGKISIAAAAITGGTINGAVIGGITPAAITGTAITANTGFAGNLTGNVVGNVTGNVTGNAGTVTTNANLTGDVTSVGNNTTIKSNVTLLGNPTTTTPTVGDNSLKIPTTAFLASALSKVPTIQIFSAGSGTYTRPAGVLWARVRMIGGGGGGGGTGSSGQTGGGTGGDTTFSTFTASGGLGGGAGGSGLGTPGSGGAASGGTININGNPGTVGGFNITGSGSAPGGNGGGSYFAGGGIGGILGVSAAVNGGANSGAGGGGGTGVISVTTAAGGGASGGYVEALITSVAASYSYSVGAGGTAGGAGASGAAGATGGAGLIIIEEYYIG